MASVFDILQERGFVRQVAAPREGAEDTRPPEDRLREVLAKPPVVFYVGFDPTADSLHAGSLVPIMAMAHLQRAGHRPIAIIGGGTTMVGDPSGRTEMRKLMSYEEIQANGVKILEQLGRYVDFSAGRGLFLNNADWLMGLKYVDFLREIGRHFKVNEMIKAEAYRQRLEREEGLSFIEFNYQLLQAYDFLVLHQRHGCTLQMGGDDQWGNILAGIELTRRVEGKTVYGLTFPLLTTARGEKMGKTAAGAVWLSASRTSAYEFYQYWINCDDRDVERFLKYFTFLALERIAAALSLGERAILDAKELLAFEVTKLCHGEAEAVKARESSKAAFGGGGADLSALPTTAVPAARLAAGIAIVDLLHEVGLAGSKSVARQLVKEGGAYVNGEAVKDIGALIGMAHVKDGGILLRSGKKKYHRVVQA